MHEIDSSPSITPVSVVDLEGHPDLEYDCGHHLEVDEPLRLAVDNRFGEEVVLTLAYPGGIRRGSSLGFMPGNGHWTLTPNHDRASARALGPGTVPTTLTWNDRWEGRKRAVVTASRITLACSAMADHKLRLVLSAPIAVGRTLRFGIEPAAPGYSRDFSLAVFRADHPRCSWPTFSMRTRELATAESQPRSSGLVLFRSLRT